MLSLNIEKREKSSIKGLKSAGKIPAVFYGKKEKSTPIAVKKIEFEKIWGKAGESSVVTLRGAGEELEALIQDVDVHPVSGAPRHADFYVFEKGQKLEVSVPLEFAGVSPAVKDLGGTLVKVMHELEIEAEPKNLPHAINVDISSLATFDNVILAKQIVMPVGVTLVTKPEEVVASVYEPKDEPVEEVARDISDIELSTEKGKKEEEGAEGEAGAAPAADAKKEPKKEGKKEEKK